MNGICATAAGRSWQFCGQRERGKPITSNPPYGYVKSPDDKNLWLVDEEAAEVVKKIFRLTVEGMGPYQIAKTAYRGKD